jgi:hypothetical protein
LLAEAAGAVGAAYIISNKWTGEVDWASFWGPSVELKPDYVAHYAALDPFQPICHSTPTGSWVSLSECLPPVLRKSEWYNDFVVKCGVRDIVAARLSDDRSHTEILGIHYGIHQSPSASSRAVQVNELLEPLGHASRLHAELRNLGWRSSVAFQALDQLAAGVIVTRDDRRVVELNRAAEEIIRRNDGLSIRHGKLCAVRVFEDTKLATLIAGAVPQGNSSGATRRMLIGRRYGRLAYI